MFRNFPLTQSHPHALIAAEAAEAAALQDKFWEMHDLPFEQQTFLKPDIIPLWAKRIGTYGDAIEGDPRSSWGFGSDSESGKDPDGGCEAGEF